MAMRFRSGLTPKGVQGIGEMHGAVPGAGRAPSYSSLRLRSRSGLERSLGTVKASLIVDGLLAFEQLALGAMPFAIRTKALKAAVTAGGKIIVAAAKKNMPKETGLLRVSIGQRNKAYPKSASAVAVIGARTNFKTKKRDKLTGAQAKRRPSKYMHLVELGTAAHGVAPRHRRVLRWEEKSGVAYFARAVRHPGTRAQEPLQRAWRSTAALRNMVMVNAINKVIKQTIFKSKARRGRPRKA